MAEDSLKLWEIVARVTGSCPKQSAKWWLSNRIKNYPAEEDVYERTFVILAPEAKDATLWVEALLSGVPCVRIYDPLQKDLDTIIHEVTDLTPLLKD